MPITPFQREVFALLKHHRSPDSFVFGTTLLNAAGQTPRYSRDIDICHDVAEAVAESAVADAGTLEAAGCEVRWQLRQPAFHRATVRRGEDSVKLEWVDDTAFRFFPVEPEDVLGCRLHFLDAATHKLLALSGRSEARYFVAALHSHETCLPLGALAWAAAGKDGGLNPLLILDLAERFARYRQEEIDALHLAAPLSLPALKAAWTEAPARGREPSSRFLRRKPADVTSRRTRTLPRPPIPARHHSHGCTGISQRWAAHGPESGVKNTDVYLL